MTRTLGDKSYNDERQFDELANPDSTRLSHMKQYHDLLRSILEHGKEHQDRTGVGTVSHFGYQTRFRLSEGFPIVTTKRVPFRWICEELFWFLSGDTNEANLRARGVDIWKEWADLEHTSRFGRAAGDLGINFYEQKSDYA